MNLNRSSDVEVGGVIPLPKPLLTSKTSLEEAILKRRTVREYSSEPISLEQLSQLLWSCQGITSDEAERTAPSAGALYPLEVYAVVGHVEQLKAGVYKYLPKRHALQITLLGDERKELYRASLGQEQVRDAAVDIVITAVCERMTWKYRERGYRYVYMEVGHAAQNLCLQTESLDLGVCIVGAFNDDGIKKVMGFADDEDPLYVLTVGHRKNR